MKYSHDKNINKLVEELVGLYDKHITVKQGGKHLCLVRNIDGRKVPIAGTPSDHRSFLNTRAQLRRFVSDLPLAA